MALAVTAVVATLTLLEIQPMAWIQDGSFGIVSTGYFLHGVDAEFRKDVLAEAARIASDYVVVFDYGKPGNFVVRFIEWVEGPHYPVYLGLPAPRLRQQVTAHAAPDPATPPCP